MRLEQAEADKRVLEAKEVALKQSQGCESAALHMYWPPLGVDDWHNFVDLTVCVALNAMMS